MRNTHSSPNPREPLSPREAAALLGVSKSTVLNAIHAGHLPHARVTKRRLVIYRDELERFIAIREHDAEHAAERLAEASAAYR